MLLPVVAACGAAAVCWVRRRRRESVERKLRSTVAPSDFVRGVPKAELHLHIEGTFEPELMFDIARRNGVALAFESVEEVRRAYEFDNLQSFLDIYYAACDVLLHERDFYDLTWAYLLRCKDDNVVHTEIFFDPQTHTQRGVAFDTVVNGIHAALEDGRAKLGINSRLIMCFLRHLSEQDAFATLDEALAHKDKISAVGLDSGEAGNPPAKFERVYAKAIEAGFRTVAHSGEEGPAQYVSDALDLLKVERVDHGVRCLEDDKVVERLVAERVPLTCCPLSNHKLQVFNRYFGGENVVKKMMDRGLVVTLNSDDPAYFGGYIGDNFAACVRELDLTCADLVKLCENAFTASFVTPAERAVYMSKLHRFATDYARKH
eukprot:TRINITY_DN104634_c0_g1_i1.p2 TRINITY_DN104634_c0_g1~~TRINITY_DN104634_c0_g1_i1.p2  ORF type:complete len:375 (-),score=231.14 TRINITY_DN104634_c0_g1_i1:2-1126(-)